MVTPTTGSLILAGKSGRQYAVSFYIADVVGTDVKFNLNGLATASSQSFYIIPEDSVIKDISLTTGPTVIFSLIIKANDVPTGSVVPIANCINTLANRAIPNIGFQAGRKFTMTEA